MFIATFVTGFVVAFVRNWRLALVVSTIVPVIMAVGGGMNHYITRYRESMLQLTSQAGTLAEEVISSIRNTHAFGTQKKLAAMYDEPNLQAMNLGIKSSYANGIGMGGFFFVIYAAYALAFYCTSCFLALLFSRIDSSDCRRNYSYSSRSSDVWRGRQRLLYAAFLLRPPCALAA